LLSANSRYVTSAIREDDELADQLRKSGKKVIKLSSGDPPIYYPTPQYIIDAYVEALREGKTSYSRSQGIPELVNAIIERYGRMFRLSLRMEDVLVTSGLSEALIFLNGAMMSANDTAVILRPYYAQYPVTIRMFGGIPLLGDYEEDNNWNVDPDSLLRLLRKGRKGSSKKPKYMLITNPNNPTGTVLSRQVLEEIVEIANENRLLLISDEIYDEIVYNGATFTSVSQLARGMPHIIMNGASKAFDATGFRIGYMLIPENDKTSEELKIKLGDYCKSRLCASTPAQYAVAKAMANRAEHERTVREMVKAIEESVNLALKLLHENEHLSVVRPNGAFYIFPRIRIREMDFKNDKEFVQALLTERLIHTTRGSGFGSPNHFRIVALAPKDVMNYCIEQVNEFCREHSGEHHRNQVLDNHLSDISDGFAH
jgi:alanine-synthesizing transaminase